MSDDGRRTWRTPTMAVQLGQTLVAIGLVALVVSLLLRGEDHTVVWVGAVVLAVGLVVVGLGLRARRRGSGG